jgi:diguanylate cyclase (GGDEF)-like protein/putative nucleotidyltransferase with HDIG domain/PAS domain S-box-containing protein
MIRFAAGVCAAEMNVMQGDAAVPTSELAVNTQFNPPGPNPPGRADSIRPMTETSRLLLELVELAHQAQQPAQTENSALEGIICPQILRRLLTTLRFRDVATVHHSRRVSKLAVGIARHLRWEELDLRRLEVAALLHDIGKIGVPDNVLFKPGKLNHDESDLMALHHRVSVDVLQAARVDPEVVQIISQSRDFSCGAARAPGLALSTLTQGARILSVADAYDSLRTDQVYHKSKSHDDTMKILLENTGTQFDGNVINALARWASACGLNKCHDYQSENQPPEAGLVTTEAADRRDADVLMPIFSHLYQVENLYDGFYVVDSDLRFVVWNDGVQRLVGQPAKRLLDRIWTGRTICFADADGRELSEDDMPLKQALESGKPTSREIKVLNAAGAWIDIELQTTPLIDSAGRLRGVAEMLRDKSRSDLGPRQYREMQRSANRDPLTGVANRNEIRTQIGHLLAAAIKDDWKTTFSLIFVDVDHFKQILEQFDHEAGDRVLMETARLLQQETYSGEIVGRYSGEQFMIVCPATGGEQALKRAERIRVSLSGLRLEQAQDWPLTGSFGVTNAVSGDTLEGVISRADKALYHATRAGRNQCAFLSPNEHNEPLLRESEAGIKPETLEFETQFLACVASDLIVFKLAAFMDEVNARVLEVSPERVRMRLGRRGLLPGWGRSDQRKPVDVELDLSSETPIRVVNGRKVRSNQVQVRVRVVPVGHARSREVFLERARGVLKELSNYFLADM